MIAIYKTYLGDMFASKAKVLTHISNVCQATCVIHVMFRYVFKRNISHDCNHQWQPKSRI